MGEWRPEVKIGFFSVSLYIINIIVIVDDDAIETLLFPCWTQNSRIG